MGRNGYLIALLTCCWQARRSRRAISRTGACTCWCYPAGGFMTSRRASSRQACRAAQPSWSGRSRAPTAASQDQAARASGRLHLDFRGSGDHGQPADVREPALGEKSFAPVGATAERRRCWSCIKSARERAHRIHRPCAQAPGALNWEARWHQPHWYVFLLNATRLDMQMVPYGGQPPAILDLMANRVHFNVASIGLVPGINSKRAQAAGVLGTARSSLLPNVPTVSGPAAGSTSCRSAATRSRAGRRSRSWTGSRPGSPTRSRRRACANCCRSRASSRSRRRA